MELDIIYRDSDIVVCIKPAGVLSESGGMPELIKAQLALDSDVYPVHRLDRAVGGLMVYALTAKAASALSAQMSGDGFEKEYLAVVQGETEEEGTLRDLLFHDKAKNKTYPVTRLRRGVKEALLEYKREDTAEGFSLLRIRLGTGRTHQIRVQFASRKLPLAGDVKYGSRLRDCPIALWSAYISFKHPRSAERLEFSAPPPRVKPFDLF